MKWNWFCPLPPAKTGIADYAAKILPSFGAHAELTLWTDQDEWDPSIARYGTVRRYDAARVPWGDLNRADLNIYHIGNHPDFHGGIWQVARTCPGLVVLHDPSLHHFFGALYRERGNMRSAYLQLMRRYYGEASMAVAVAFFDRAISTEFMAEHFPLTWHALENALGVIVHSYKAFSELKAAERLPSAYIPLPYLPKNFVAPTNKPSRNDIMRIVVFGFLGRNRRLDQILQAIAGLERRDRICLEICGEVFDGKQTSALIAKLRLGEIVRLRGFLSNEDLETVLSRSDLALNLRYPSMGEASLSQLRIWEHALPTVVTQVGWYATLPEDAVCFVRPEQEIEDIQRHLNALLDDPERFERMGERGRVLLETNHSPATYAKTLAEFATSLRGSTNVAIERLTERAGHIAADWLGEDVDLAIFENPARQILAATGNE